MGATELTVELLLFPPVESKGVFIKMDLSVVCEIILGDEMEQREEESRGGGKFLEHTSHLKEGN